MKADRRANQQIANMKKKLNLEKLSQVMNRRLISRSDQILRDRLEEGKDREPAGRAHEMLSAENRRGSREAASESG